MPYQNDKVSNVLAVLIVMKNEARKTRDYRNTTELRIEAVKEVAEAELRAQRYKNAASALKTIQDAYARRLKPDVSSTKHFDKLADEWLHQNSIQLKDILLKHAENHSQRAVVTDFFASKN